MNLKLIKQFLELESSSGIILLLAAALSMLWANSAYAHLHQQLSSHLLFLINDGLMAVFFLLIGIELKQGYLEGFLSTFHQVALPLVAALGGMIVPALLFIAINYHHPIFLQAWATPVATDIAFAVGVLSFFGQRVPFALKLFLLALAIFDDIGAVTIIGLFYTQQLAYFWLLHIVMLAALLYLFNRIKLSAFTPYFLIALALWFAMFKAGIHPTLSGFLLGILLPARDQYGLHKLSKLQSALHPWSAFVIMPLFALVNAGFSLQDLPQNIWLDTLVLGIIVGLFIGKQLGVFGSAYFLIKLKWAKLPEKTTWLQLYGVALLCGIGFTMSLFLGTLSFQNHNNYLAEVRLGVMTGSLISALSGMLALFFAFKYKDV